MEPPDFDDWNEGAIRILSSIMIPQLEKYNSSDVHYKTAVCHVALILKNHFQDSFKSCSSLHLVDACSFPTVVYIGVIRWQNCHFMLVLVHLFPLLLDW